MHEYKCGRTYWRDCTQIGEGRRLAEDLKVLDHCQRMHSLGDRWSWVPGFQRQWFGIVAYAAKLFTATSAFLLALLIPAVLAGICLYGRIGGAPSCPLCVLCMKLWVDSFLIFWILLAMLLTQLIIWFPYIYLPPGIAAFTGAWGILTIILKVLDMKLSACFGDTSVGILMGVRRPRRSYDTDPYHYSKVPYLDGSGNHTALHSIRSRLRGGGDQYTAGQVMPLHAGDMSHNESCFQDDMAGKLSPRSSARAIAEMTPASQSGQVLQWRRGELAANHSPGKMGLSGGGRCFCEAQAPCTSAE